MKAMNWMPKVRRFARDNDGKTALDLATAPVKPPIPATAAPGRRQCADLLRGNRQIQTPDAKILTPNQNTNSPAGELEP